MVSEIITTLTEAFTPESGVTISSLDEENFSSPMVPSMREVGKIISCTAQATSLITSVETGQGNIVKESTKAESKPSS